MKPQAMRAKYRQVVYHTTAPPMITTITPPATRMHQH